MTQHDLDYAGRRLQLLGSRVVEPEMTGHRVIPTHHHQHQHQHQLAHSRDETESLNPKDGAHDTPKFSKPEAATNFELFYDLWFVANLNVFTSIHDISDFSRFTSFIGYMVLLWTTWGLTTLYDVRFTADSIWERCCKAVHLGVMIGFAEIGTSFDPDNQIVSIFRTMSLFLAVSRFVLFLQYATVAFQIRKYADGKRPMIFTAILHFCASMIYLGVSFRYDLGKSSRVFLVWYIGGVIEMLMHLVFSQMSHVLTFLGTHLGERLNLLTLVILGEGCIILAKSITLLVKDTFAKDASYTLWSPTLIGLVTAGTALIYIIFQIYFDWMHDEHSMSKRHQVWWTSLHLPFHIALVLLLEGTSQFVIWARIVESANSIISKILDTEQKALTGNPTSEEVSEKLSDLILPFLKKYQPLDVLETMKSVNETLEEIADMPDSFWSSDPSPDDSMLEHYVKDLAELTNTMINAVYNAFGFNPPEGQEKESLENTEFWQTAAAVASAKRFILVYIYAFACAGIVLLFLTIMHVISKRKGWSPFNIFRTAICISISIILALLTIIAANQEAVLENARNTAFVGSSWMLPTITISYFIVLVLTHLPHPSGFCMGHFRKRTYDDVEKPNGVRKTRDLNGMRDTRGIADFEDRRTGYTGAGPDMASPQLPDYDEPRTTRYPSEARRSRPREERRASRDAERR
ncbi:uncharacterized protein GGS22DRAFT_153621 [Annulohypoxylon maeteangense]|uniref:uncharacterized protein n=1 Tax=Annulohypoxylon maeteangense TaxID=1927788 RepID=UPI002008BA4E|nr:uncharacterized protein GGS22DRAFT_153621 [Annulohypoxylon maeteangense]KAI0889311.1 hypothetical protein GGS22DRAFT_153621 [Annulohypoxylon maeteangense]